MAIEQDELKLTVALDDQASAGLGNLQKQLQGIVFSIAPAQAGLKSLGQSLRGVGGHAHSAHGSLGGLARGGFVAGIFFEIGRQAEQMAKEFAEAVLDIKEYADTMVKLDQVSSRAAQSMGQFRANVAVFRESGVGQEQATKMLSGYANALADLQRPGGRIVQDLLRGQTGAARERMEDLIRTITTSSQTQSINAIRQAGRAIRAEHERQGRPELGAASEASFYARLGMPGLENVRHELHEISADEERMYNDRRKDAERYQTSLNKQADAWERSVQGIQSIAFQLFPIASASEASAGFFSEIAKGVDAIDRSMRNTNTEVDKARSEAARKKVVTPEGREITAQESLSEDERQKQILQRRLNPRRTTTTRTGETLPPDFSDISETGDVKDVTGRAKKEPGKDKRRPSSGPSARRTSLLSGEVATGKGLGEEVGAALGGGGAVGLGVGGAVDRLPEEYEEIGWAQIEDRRGEAPLPIEQLYLTEQSARLELLTDEVNQLNEYLAPELMKMLLAGTGAPAFHNAPMGGVAGESNPMQLPANASQPGGGAASEAAQAARAETKSRIATSMSEAMKYLEKNESKHAADLKDYMNTGGRNLTGDNNAWCARFVDAIQTRAGLPSLESSLPQGQKAGQKDDATWSSRAYENWGRGVKADEDIREGDVFVKARKGGGHVGVATGNYRVNPTTGEREYEMLSGNIGGAPKGGGEVNTTWESIGGARGDKKEGTAGAGHGAVIAVRRGEAPPADTGPEEGAGKGRRLDPTAEVPAQLAATNISYRDDDSASAFQAQKDAAQIPAGTFSARARMERAGTERVWTENRERALEEADREVQNDPTVRGYHEWESAQPGEGYGGGSQLPGPGAIGRAVDVQQKSPEEVQRSEEYYSGDWQTRGRGNNSPNFNPRTGEPLPYEELGRQGKQEINLNVLDGGGGAILDRAAANNVDVNQSGRLTVDVNAPAGTSVSTEGAGVFNQTETNRSVPMEPAQVNA